LLTATFVIFSVISQGKTVALDRRGGGGKWNHFSTAHSVCWV